MLLSAGIFGRKMCCARVGARLLAFQHSWEHEVPWPVLPPALPAPLTPAPMAVTVFILAKEKPSPRQHSHRELLCWGQEPWGQSRVCSGCPVTQGRDFKPHLLHSVLWPGAPSTVPACPKPHPTLPWTLQGWGSLCQYLNELLDSQPGAFRAAPGRGSTHTQLCAEPGRVPAWPPALPLTPSPCSPRCRASCGAGCAGGSGRPSSRTTSGRPTPTACARGTRWCSACWRPRPSTSSSSTSWSTTSCGR